MIMAGPIVIKACANLPSGPGLRLSSTASNVLAQKSIALAGSRHTSLGMTTDEFSGMPLALAAIRTSNLVEYDCDPIPLACSQAAARSCLKDETVSPK